MTPKKDEQRAPDQQAALEDAFVAGTLPEDDRRTLLHDDTFAPGSSIAFDTDSVRITSVESGVKRFGNGRTLSEAMQDLAAPQQITPTVPASA